MKVGVILVKPKQSRIKSKHIELASYVISLLFLLPHVESWNNEEIVHSVKENIN